MATQFNVTFVEQYGASRVEKECNYFYERTDERYLVDEVQLVENSLLSVLFEAPPGYKLYIDGIDQLEEQYVQEDEKGLYIVPSETPYVLYHPAKNKPYPFIPGTYFLMVSTPSGESLEARARVLTKRVTEDQHTIMVQEIERAVRGLSSELTNRRMIYNEVALDIFGPKKIDEYSMILSSREKIISGLHAIGKNRRYSVVKDYPVIPKHRAKKIDSKSIKYLMMHPEQQKTIQAPVSTVTYNIPENRWIKFIVRLILKNVNEMQECFGSPHIKNYNMVQAQELLKEVNYLRNELTLFLTERWIQDISENISGQIPLVFFSAGQYSIFYKLYRMIKQGTKQNAAEPKLQFHYKRSDILYEIWGYLKVINILRDEHGFTMRRNWLQIDQNTLDQVIVPGQNEVDYVELVRDNYKIRIFYDELLPKRREQLSPLVTMRTLDNNRPDCRIDVWVEEKYKGSLIIDFKYRKREYLWNDADLEEGRQIPKVMRQLANYSNGMSSYTTKLNGVRNQLIDAKPVTEVWAVYPIKWEETNPDYKLNEYDVRLIDLSPGTENTYFSAMLEEAIDEIIDR
ncbi:restriction endonuclease-like protein [Sporosarcina sp. ACRSL]|uniref:DUF2357 domain-containing protein n=1 Tax=Sporosarcina sp. ACRSL TaxID=2918215 RepID=UPI001EF6D3E9|nr:DUF2357 domain-containing protein [Sporosarcina sp. ACRSL]MCG7344794.1 restriction endonuclease-like protein [Sporosarcina sp. ACRSL]